jgi:hypothetical protein
MGKSRKRAIAGTPADASLPKTPVTVGGKTYNLCFDLGALSEAETAINLDFVRRDDSRRVNLLAALPFDDLANTRIVFAAAVRKFHPELGFEEAMGLLGLDDVYRVWGAIRAAWDASRPQSEGTPGPTDPAK